ncbi:hypothetical protein BDU57DRAFT_545488 [Ampelomyces quisqualis]|uniref:Uncharacterized protein n=1 Tax=Ampelomyces quisqualis TaxID=50730 RepID=A0A6A5QSA2_AMPQU|nr:hypothetical protein BDU57DRAFT_545488 [Ampelomyces quisqualis]
MSQAAPSFQTPNPEPTIPGWTGNSITQKQCDTRKQVFNKEIYPFNKFGGIASMAADMTSFPNVAEIVELILLCLDHETVVRATGVCKFWKNCVAGSKPLMQKIYKLPGTIYGDENLPFKELTKAARDATVPQFEYQGRNIWNLVRDIEDTFLDSIHDVSTEELEKCSSLDQDNDEETASYKFYKLRACFMGIRYPNGWPAELQELHCDLCDQWHTDFKYENLHPLFRFLGDVTCCFRGNSKHLVFAISIVSTQLAPASCWEHSREEALHFAKGLATAYKAVQAGGTAKDFWLSPPATKLVTSGCCIEDNTGLKLEAVLFFIFRMFRGHLLLWRNHCHEFETKEVQRSRRTVRDTAAAFPTTKDWDNHMANYSTIRCIWETAVGEVDEILIDVPYWKPVLAEENKELTWDVYQV